MGPPDKKLGKTLVLLLLRLLSLPTPSSDVLGVILMAFVMTWETSPLCTSFSGEDAKARSVGDSFKGSGVRTREQRKLEGFNVSEYCIHRQLVDDPLADGHLRAGVKGAVAAIQLIKQYGRANCEPSPSLSPETSSITDVSGREYLLIGSSLTPRVGTGFHSGEYCEGIGQTDGLTFWQNSHCSSKLTTSICDSNDSSTTTGHVLISSGRARPYGSIFPLHCSA